MNTNISQMCPVTNDDSSLMLWEKSGMLFGLNDHKTKTICYESYENMRFYIIDFPDNEIDRYIYPCIRRILSYINFSYALSREECIDMYDTLKSFFDMNFELFCTNISIINRLKKDEYRMDFEAEFLSYFCSWYAKYLRKRNILIEKNPMCQSNIINYINKQKQLYEQQD